MNLGVFHSYSGQTATLQPSAALAKIVQAWPGVAVADQGPRFHVAIPDRYRIGHEAHFAEVTQQFLKYVAKRQSIPAWEKPNMLAKYGVTTGGVALARGR